MSHRSQRLCLAKIITQNVKRLSEDRRLKNLIFSCINIDFVTNLSIIGRLYKAIEEQDEKQMRKTNAENFEPNMDYLGK